MTRPRERMAAKDKEGRSAYPGPLLFYNETVIDHFTRPRNVGELAQDETDGFGLVGDPSCGDQMKLWICVRSGRIAKIAFKSFGCPGAIATSSMLTALAQGRASRKPKASQTTTSWRLWAASPSGRSTAPCLA